MSTVLVVGATGLVGSEICRQLTAAGRPVRALVRTTSDQAKVDNLKSLGVETVQGNLCDPASLQAACRGVDAVISTASSMPFAYQPGVNDVQCVDHDGLANLIGAAQAARVSHFIYTSFSGRIELDCPLRNAKRAVERRLKESGLVYTILRPSYFAEVWLSPAVGFDFANAKATIYGSGQNPISWISVQDVARFAVASLDNPAARNATIEMGGPQALSPLQVVSIFEQVGRRKYEVQHVPEEALQAQQAGATDPMQQSFAALTRAYAQGDPIEMQAKFKTFAVQPTTVEEYARRVLA